MTNTCRLLALVGCGVAALSALSRDLVWNGGAGGVWSGSAQVWLDGATPCAWEEGATAVFGGCGLVTVQDEIHAGGIRFTSTGTTLVGSGLVYLNGALDAAAGTENAIAVRLYADTAMAKTGAGTVSLGYTRGALAIDAGTVYAGGYNLHDTAVTVAPGAVLKSVSPVRPVETTNLVANGSFESPTQAGYAYVKDGELTGWTRGAANYIVLSSAAAQKNTWGNALATVPDGKQIVAVQMNGEISQTVTVAEDGFYDLSFYFFRRGTKTNYEPHQIYLSLDGALWQTFFDDIWSGTPKLANTGAVYLKAGAHTLKIAGEGNWGDTATFVDDVVLTAPDLADATSVPAGRGTVADVPSGEATLSETYALVKDTDQEFAYFTKTGAGRAIFTQNLALPCRTVYDVEGEAVYETGNIVNGYSLYKTGAGSLTIPSPVAGCTYKVMNGSLKIKTFTSSATVKYVVSKGVTAGFYPGLAAGDVTMPSLNFSGNGTCLLGTLGDGHTLTVRDGSTMNTPSVWFDVGAGDTLTYGPLRAELVGNRKDYCDTDVVKLGSGAMVLANHPGGYAPTTFTVRAGTLTMDFSDDAWTYSYTRTEGAPVSERLGALMRGLSTPLALGDYATPADGTAAFYANAASFAMTRPIDVHARVATATLGTRQGFARFDGATTFSRRLALDAPAGTTLVIGDLRAPAGAAPSVSAASAGSVYLNGSVPAALALEASGGTFALGYRCVRTAAVASLSVSGACEFSFDGAGNDRFDVAGALRLGALEISLRDDATGGAFDVPGTYTLFTCGSLAGDVSSITLSDASRQSGYDYALAAADGAITLTIAAQASNPVFTWTGATGGSWTGGSWDHATAPSGTDKTARFAATVADDATIALEASETIAIGGILFHSAKGYTISGGTLKPGSIRVASGRHTVASKLVSDGADPVALSATAGGTLVLDGELVGDFRVTSGTVAMGPNARVKGHVAVASGARLATVALDATGALSFEPTTGWNADNTATYLAPATGRYFFTREGAAAYSFAIDGETILDSATKRASGWTSLAKGPHLVARSSADVTVKVRAPGASATVGLSDADLRQDAGPDLVSGAGLLAPAAGETFALVQTNSLDAPFTGGLAGAGAFVRRNGGEFAARYDSGSILVREGAVSILSATGTVSVARTASGAALNVARPLAVAGLEGAGTVTLGAHAYARRIEGDADCGISPAKTYTHLCNFTADDYNLPVNGVTFSLAKDLANAEGVCNAILGEEGNPGVVPPAGETGFAALVRKLALGNAKTNSFVLTGLEPGKAYDFRMYLRPFGNNDRRFIHDFIQSGRVIASLTWDPDHSLGDAPASTANLKPYSVVGCRYVADATGRLQVRMVKANMSDGNGFHYYAFSNELADDAPVSDPTVTDAPAAGTRAAFTGTVKGTYGLTVDGEGLQVFGRGAVIATRDFTVASGETRLESGAVSRVPAKVDAGATLGLWADSRVAGVTGEGTVDLQLAEEDLRDGVAADGSFPLANAGDTYPRQVFVTNDVSSGFSPHKTYTVAHCWTDNGIAPMVNGVIFTCGNSAVATNSAGVGVVSDAGSGCYGTQLAFGSEYDVYWLYVRNLYMSYGKSSGYFKATGLTPGVTYEARVYLGGLGTNNSRRTRWSADEANSSGTTNVVHVIQDAPDKKPFYVAVRYTAKEKEKSIVWYRDSTSGDAPHVQGFSNEIVTENVRELCVSNDCTFAGAVTGPGELAKTGPAKQTFTGALDAKALWTVREGTLEVTNPSSVFTNVCVAGGVFAGVGRVTGDLGVCSGGTLRVGTDGLAVGNRLVVAGSGALAFACGAEKLGCLSVKDAAIPDGLVLAVTAEGPDARVPVRAKVLDVSGAFAGDVSTWRASGTLKGLRNIRFFRSGNAVVAMRAGFTVTIR